MSASTPLRPALLSLLLVLLLVPASAHAAPRPAAPVAAHQDDWAEEGGWDDADPAATEEGDWSDEGEDWGDDDGTDADDAWSEDEEDWGDDDWDDGSSWEEETTPAAPVITYAKGTTVKGRVAMLRRNGKAAVPRNAPKRVKLVIAAANKIVGKPYKWGGGHAKLVDRGYDCSGTVSYALIRSGLLTSPLVSGSFAKWGRSGAGKWITIHANKGHVYMEVAGLRLDTSAMGDPAGGKGPRWRPAIGKRPGFKVRHIAGL